MVLDRKFHPPISRWCRFSLLLGLLAAGSLALAATPPAADDRLLLLTNGQVLRGQVSLHGDDYLVTLPYGEIRVPLEQVEHVCGTLEEGLRLKQNAIRFGSATQHLRLANWCLDHELHEAARQQLATAMSLDPPHRWAAATAHRLAVASREAQPVVPPVTVSPPATDASQLEALVRQLPPGAVESFTQTIQPLLVNSCSSRSCHGAAATNDFRLHRFPPGQKPRRRVTLRNLEAVLPWVDRDDPTASRLVYAATHPHGVSRQSALLSDHSQRKLWEWVQGLATPSSSPPATDGPLEAPPEGPAFAAGRSALHNPAESQPVDGGRAPRKTADRQRSAAEGGHPYDPRDPFDPEIFNRRYHAP